MKHMTTALAVIMTAMAVTAHPTPHCPRIPRHPPPQVHRIHRGPYPHNGTEAWVGIGILGCLAINNLVNAPSQTVVVQQPVVIQPQTTAIWVPERRIISYDSNGNQIITVIPGHYEYR